MIKFDEISKKDLVIGTLMAENTELKLEILRLKKELPEPGNVRRKKLIDSHLEVIHNREKEIKVLAGAR